MINSNIHTQKHTHSYHSPLPKSNIYNHQQTKPFYTASSSFSTIDPAWHLIASLESVLNPKIHKQQRSLF